MKKSTETPRVHVEPTVSTVVTVPIEFTMAKGRSAIEMTIPISFTPYELANGKSVERALSVQVKVAEMVCHQVAHDGTRSQLVTS